MTFSRIRAFIALCTAAILGFTGVRSALRWPRLRRVEIALDKLPSALDGFRIAQISDLHIGPLLGGDFAKEVTAAVNKLSPDLIAVTGDLVDGPVSHLRNEVAPFAELSAPHGVYFVTGNHEYYSGVNAWISEVESYGWRVLRNETVTIRQGDDCFLLAGVDDHRASLFGGGHGEDLQRALGGSRPTQPHAVILLAHDPTTFSAAAKYRIDLQLSGHTHGGQIWPFGALVWLFVRFVSGIYRRGDAQLFVSRGTGFWGPPLRLWAPAEIVEITLRACTTTPKP